MNKDEKVGIVAVTAFYELILTKRVGDESKRGLTVQTLQKENLYYEFALIMAEFEKKRVGFELEPDLDRTCQLILESWDRHHISPQFTEDVIRILREDDLVNEFFRTAQGAIEFLRQIGRTHLGDRHNQ